MPGHIATVVQWGPSNTWKACTKVCISHIMWLVQPSFELIVLSPTVFLRCALLGKHDCAMWPLQGFVYGCLDTHTDTHTHTHTHTHMSITLWGCPILTTYCILRGQIKGFNRSVTTILFEVGSYRTVVG